MEPLGAATFPSHLSRPCNSSPTRVEIALTMSNWLYNSTVFMRGQMPYTALVWSIPVIYFCNTTLWCTVRALLVSLIHHGIQAVPIEHAKNGRFMVHGNTISPFSSLLLSTDCSNYGMYLHAHDSSKS